MQSTLVIVGLIVAFSTIAYVLVFLTKQYESKNNHLSLIINHIKTKGVTMAEMTTTQFVDVELTPKNRLGAPALVQPGSVLFQTTDAAVLVVEADPENELKVKVVAKGEGTAKLQYTADADLGEGVVAISGEVTFLIQPAQAEGFGITLGEPQEQEIPA